MEKVLATIYRPTLHSVPACTCRLQARPTELQRHCLHLLDAGLEECQGLLQQQREVRGCEACAGDPAPPRSQQEY
eukprot:3303389-Amphidinium_carterae.1